MKKVVSKEKIKPKITLEEKIKQFQKISLLEIEKFGKKIGKCCKNSSILKLLKNAQEIFTVLLNKQEKNTVIIKDLQYKVVLLENENNNNLKKVRNRFKILFETDFFNFKKKIFISIMEVYFNFYIFFNTLEIFKIKNKMLLLDLKALNSGFSSFLKKFNISLILPKKDSLFMEDEYEIVSVIKDIAKDNNKNEKFFFVIVKMIRPGFKVNNKVFKFSLVEVKKKFKK